MSVERIAGKKKGTSREGWSHMYKSANFIP